MRGRRTMPAVAGVVLGAAAVLGLIAWQAPTLPPQEPLPSAGAPFAAPGEPPTSVPLPGRELHVTAAGDYSARPAAAAVLARIGAIKPDLHFALGDLSYGVHGSEQSWCDLVTSNTGTSLPFELVSGNHESNGLNGNIDDFAACLPNRLPGLVGTYGRQYYADVPLQEPLARFIMVSPGIPFADGPRDYTPGSPNYEWTAAAIDDARTAGIPWVVVGMHTPCLSMGVYDCPAGTAITTMMLTKKVDLVLNAHEHLYQRSKQLSVGPGCPGIQPGIFTADCVNDGDNTLEKGSGTVFATVGTGGTDLRDINAGDPEAAYFAAYSGRNASPSHGLLDLRLTETSLTARFIATSGAFQDQFQIGSGN